MLFAAKELIVTMTSILAGVICGALGIKAYQKGKEKDDTSSDDNTEDKSEVDNTETKDPDMEEHTDENTRDK